MIFSRQEILLACGLAFLALIFGWFSGAFGWAFFAAALVWVAMEQRERARLIRWSRRPLTRPQSERDPWEDLAYRLYRAIGRARARHARTLREFRSLRAITDSLPDSAIIVDRHGNIENLNNAAQEMLRLTPTDRGNHLSSLVRDLEFNALVKGQIDGDLVEFASPFNADKRLEARRIEMDDGYAMILVRDVTELNRLLSMRQDFIANVSHELRTPLTVIVGYIETLMNEELDEATTRGLVGKLLSPTTRMRALVDDLLLLTRLESSPNPSQDELTSVDMGVVLNAIAADARMLSSGRHDIQVEIGTRTHVLGIDSELHSACLNLVTNAVRYSPDGGPIRISWTEVPDGARFAVEDHGMGIPKEHISRITERFYRVDLAQSRVRGGTGLGLAIVKHVLKRHNTFLQVESELGKGSTFFCVFPSSQLAVA
ncbi:MAG: phosphate regulon sensor histidine kinase PhoR [Pseudomonadales bacterium]|jgi:two-component system phosphate regulon sensor histidine kinase PhoR